MVVVVVVGMMLVLMMVLTGSYRTRGRGRRCIFKARNQANLPITVCILHRRKRRSTHIAVRREIVGGEDTVPLGELGALGAEGRGGEVCTPQLVKGRGAGSLERGAGGTFGGRRGGRGRGRRGGGGRRRGEDGGVLAVVLRPLLARR